MLCFCRPTAWNVDKSAGTVAAILVMRMKATAGEGEGKLAGAWTLEDQVRLRVMRSHR